MSEISRSRQAKKEREQVSQVRAPETERPAADAGLASLQDRAGNQAVQAAVKSGGQPLAGATRAQMEVHFGEDFGEVRVHTDNQAAESAAELSATAFTAGDHIVFDRGEYAPESSEGRDLLAHELAHVVQQRTASVDPDRISQPDEPSEQAASKAAATSRQGQLAGVGGGRVPGIQRQFRHNAAGRPEVEQEIEAYLKRVMQAEGSRTVRVTPEVQQAMEMLANAPRPDWDGPGGDPTRAIRVGQVQAFLQRTGLPAKPDDFARQIARMLPSPFARAPLERLQKLPRKGRASTTLQRVGELVKRTAPGGPEQEAEKAAGEIARGERKPESTAASRPVTAPGTESAIERADREEQIGAAMGGQEAPSRHIVPVPVGRIGRIIGGLPEALKEPAKQRPEARTYPAVEKAVAGVAADALVPGEIRGTKRADNFADARTFARDVARKLDVAQQEEQSVLTIELGFNYAQVPDRLTILQAAREIITRVWQALPHGAANVDFVDVTVAGKRRLRVPRPGKGE